MFQNFINQSVVMQVALNGSKVSLCGTLLRDDPDAVILRVGGGLDVAVYKAAVLAIEESPV
jgi:hypothetical protein